MARVNSKLTTTVSLVLALLGAVGFLPAVETAYAQGAPPQATEPFAGLAGKWSGDGSIVLTSGATERLRCDADYTISGGGDNLDLSLQCASDSYNFDLRIALADKAGQILGSWNEVTKSITGGISGQDSKGLIQVKVGGQDFNAAVVVKTHETEQLVSIRAQSGELSQVAITLHRAR